MKDGFIRVGAVSPMIRVADVCGNTDSCIRAAERAAELGVKVLVFPELVLSGATAGDLFFSGTLTDACAEGLKRFAAATKKLDMICFIGLPYTVGGRLLNVVAAVSGGRVLSLVSKSQVLPDEARYFTPYLQTYCVNLRFGDNEIPVGRDCVFCTESLSELGIAVEVGSDSSSLISTARRLAGAGANMIINPSASVELVGSYESRRAGYCALSRDLRSAYIVAEAGFGESGTDGVYAGRCAIYENGSAVAESLPFSGGEIVYAVIDVDKLSAGRRRDPRFAALYDGCQPMRVHFDIRKSDTEFSVPPRRSPFVPEDTEELGRRAERILSIQAYALAGRIERSHSSGVVLGVSGGLDSTLALLVAAGATDILGLQRTAITSVTMPCFGTTDRTKGNAERLADALGTALRCIDIKKSVLQHFDDIGHDAEDHSVVYENSQARERTQVLMDIANASGALVVGTGDLSELALGWATYNGDHMSMYGVNGGIPKTLMRHLVSYCADRAEKKGDTELALVLRNVLATPVSPELLPPKDGEIAQCTEGIVGPYELHDFFLYYHVRYGFTPSKILRLAVAAFDGVYSCEVIEGWLKVFLRRFFAQQFKRSCLPDGPKIGSVGLSPRGDLLMPSDAVGEEWIKSIK